MADIQNFLVLVRQPLDFFLPNIRPKERTKYIDVSQPPFQLEGDELKDAKHQQVRNVGA